MNQIQEIQQNTEHLLEIHQDLHRFVRDQGEQVDEVETNINSVQDNVKGGFRNLVQASKYVLQFLPSKVD